MHEVKGRKRKSGINTLRIETDVSLRILTEHDNLSGREYGDEYHYKNFRVL